MAFPSLGGSAKSGRVTQWLKVPGDHVEVGEPLAEIETEKVSVEMPAPITGTLCDALGPLRRDIATGTIIAGIRPPGVDVQ